MDTSMWRELRGKHGRLWAMYNPVTGKMMFKDGDESETMDVGYLFQLYFADVVHNDPLDRSASEVVA